MRKPVIGLMVAAIVVASCGFLPSSRPERAQCRPDGARACTTLHGVALGEFAQSWDVAAPPCKHDCDRPVEVASADLKLRLPNHPPLTSIDEYAYDRSVLCGDTLCTVSGYLGIFVFTFDDSTTMPIVVRCPGVAACRVTERYGSPR